MAAGAVARAGEAGWAGGQALLSLPRRKSLYAVDERVQLLRAGIERGIVRYEEFR